MRVTVVRSGGFAGLVEPLADVDTAALPPAKARRVEELVRDADFFALPERVGESIGADRYQYQITVTDGARRGTVAFVADEASPATGALHQLADAVIR